MRSWGAPRRPGDIKPLANALSLGPLEGRFETDEASSESRLPAMAYDGTKSSARIAKSPHASSTPTSISPISVQPVKRRWSGLIGVDNHVV